VNREPTRRAAAPHPALGRLPETSLARRSIPFSPPRALAIVFLLVIALGTGLLLLPGMTTTPITPLQALFTATSATMVTGLTVVDTGTTFTWAGQLVLVLLMKLGGVGTMAFGALALLVSGGKPPLRSQLLVGEATGHTSFRDLGRVIRLALLAALLVEGVGALLLMLRFAGDYPFLEALWHAVFHSVAAYNNAGFALWPDSLVRYATDPLVTLVICAQVVIGGLGFVVLADPKLFRGRAALHTRITLAATAFLLLAGAATFWWLEAGNAQTLGGHPPATQALMATFLSVMPRSGGFNNIDMAAMSDGGTVLTMALMFIGGGTGSTAGGVKVTTVVIMLAATLAVLRQRNEAVLLGRTLATETVFRAFAVLSISGALLLGGFWLLVLTQPLPFEDLLFEATSAFATVGLSRGITSQLDPVGQLLLVAMMFIGRLGPLTLAYTLATAVAARVQYPKAEVYVG
jgi:trk system potassium uptake protein TrkH